MSPLTPVLTWEDSRARKIVARWKWEEKGEHLYSLTGCPLHPMYSPAKIAWWRENYLDSFAKISYFVTLKAFILFRLTGKLLEDQATLSGTGMLNIHHLGWEDEALKFAGITREQVAPIVPPTYIIEGLQEEIAVETGLSPSVKVIIGSSDAAMSSLGSGTIRPEQMTIMIGTSGAARRLIDFPVMDSQQRTFCYYMGNNKWFAGGAINNGGVVLRWFRDNFGDRAAIEAKERGVSVYTVLCDYAKNVGPGADGLLFLPFLAGERAPYWNGNMRGMYFGLSLHHGQAAFIRALMEGVSYRMFSVYKPLNELLGDPEEIRVTGGFSRSQLWLQILADVIGRDLFVTDEPEGSVLGAAAFAFYTLGELKSFESLEEMNPIKQLIHCQPEVHQFYAKEFERYLRIYHKIKDEFRA
jgi:gluconokinase